METTAGLTFKRTKLAQYSQIDTPGKYKVKVSNNVSEKNLFTDENSRERYIVSLEAIAKDKLPQVEQVFADSEEVAIEATNGLFLTGSIWKNGDNQPSLPMKGEEVEVTIDNVVSRESEQVLRVTNIRVAAAKVAAKVSLSFATADAITA